MQLYYFGFDDFLEKSIYQCGWVKHKNEHDSFQNYNRKYFIYFFISHEKDTFFICLFRAYYYYAPDWNNNKYDEVST